MCEGLVPLRQVFERGVDTAVAQRCRGVALVVLCPDAMSPGVSVGAVDDFVLVLYICDGLLHAQGSEDAITQKLAERHAGDFLDYHGQHNISRVAVLPM